jgi:DNA mismatch repair protein MutL
VTCPPDEVDVNIHPTKSAVKFVDAKKAFRVVHYALREAIEKAPWRQGAPAPEKTFVAPEVNESFTGCSFDRTQFQQKQSLTFDHPHNFSSDEKVSIETLKQAAVRDVENSLDQILTDTTPSTTETQTSSSYWSTLQVIGQVDLTYIVTQAQDKMVLVDQHAAHERVAFEKLMKAWKQGGIEIQQMLLPITVDLEESEVEALLSVTDDLQKIGVTIEQEGPASIAISSLPSIIKEKGLVEALKKLAFEINDKGGSFVMETTIGDIFATMACHSVIRAGQALSHAEMVQLLKDMDEFPLSGYCPHGRSVSLDFSFGQLEKDFGRRV